MIHVKENLLWSVLTECATGLNIRFTWSHLLYFLFSILWTLLLTLLIPHPFLFVPADTLIMLYHQTLLLVSLKFLFLWIYIYFWCLPSLYFPFSMINSLWLFQLGLLFLYYSKCEFHTYVDLQQDSWCNPLSLVICCTIDLLGLELHVK